MEKVTSRKIRRALKRLGKTPEEVTRRLEELGIRGWPSDPHRCPIANYLGKEFETYGIRRMVMVGRQSATIRVANDYVTAPTTKAVKGFIKQYDESFGKYGY